ncbi:hypothetical protein Syun_031748 [Stephania yunnanensis]|uniref:NADH-quinone oxidoreductase subunit D domain-containing protein n=3 Tax=Magnoliopsida TaxID=3398 RepID=A0AAP0HGW5_9MAGN
MAEERKGSFWGYSREQIQWRRGGAFTTDLNDQTTRKKSIGLKEISKKVPRWAYKLTDDLKEQERENEEESTEDRGIRSRKAKRVVIFTDNEQNANTNTVPQNTSNRNPAAEVALIRYSQQSDFRRDLIKGSMRTQRRKTVTWELERVIGNRDENLYDLLVPENILSPRRRREFRIRICFNSEKVNVVVKNLVFPTGNNEGNRVPFLDESKHFDIDNISSIHGIMNRGKNMPVPATRKGLMRVNMGPHHPSMHGVLRLIVTLDGEDVIDCEPILEAITVNGPEQLGNIQVPKLASYIRVIMLELSRIASHLLWLGPFMADIGVTEYQKLITRNPIFLERVEGVGVIGGEEAINWGLSGPMLRASGIQWDLRKVDNYEIHKNNSTSPGRNSGGPYENLEVRRLDRARDSEWNDFEYRFISKKPSPTLELSKQELYVRVEAPKGELGIFLIGDQSVFPWRWKIRPPGFINLQILPQLVKRMKLADIMTILGVQQRIGPEYAGPLGILQALADGTKLLFKEDLLPSRGDIRLFSIGPSIAVISIFISYSVIPFGYRVVLDDLSIGVFLWIAISSIAPIGLLISSTVDIVEAQSKYGFGGWNLWRQPIGFAVFLISSLAECERLPFDLPEAEEELVAGYQTEYSAIAAAEAAIGLAIVSSIHRNRRSIRIITVLLGATLALAQRDIKRSLAYSTMSQLGYMMLALGSGSVIHSMEPIVGYSPDKSQNMALMGGKGKGPSPLFGPIVGEEGFEPPTPWFVATCSNPLSYRPHPVSTGSVPGSTPKRNLSSPQPFSGLRRCESAFLSIRTVPSEDLPYSIVTAVEFNHQVRDGLVWFLYA